MVSHNPLAGVVFVQIDLTRSFKHFFLWIVYCPGGGYHGLFSVGSCLLRLFGPILVVSVPGIHSIGTVFSAGK